MLKLLINCILDNLGVFLSSFFLAISLSNLFSSRMALFWWIIASWQDNHGSLASSSLELPYDIFPCLPSSVGSSCWHCYGLCEGHVSRDELEDGEGRWSRWLSGRGTERWAWRLVWEWWISIVHILHYVRVCVTIVYECVCLFVWGLVRNNKVINRIKGYKIDLSWRLLLSLSNTSQHISQPISCC